MHWAPLDTYPLVPRKDIAGVDTPGARYLKVVYIGR